MKRDWKLWQLLGFTVTAVGGTLLHFLYEWSGNSGWAAPFSGVNESTWEHMKLLFFPAVIFAVVQGVLLRGERGFWWVKWGGLWRGLLGIPVLFYTLNGAFGKTPDWLNITIFFLSAAGGCLWEYRRFSSPLPRREGRAVPLLLMAILLALFVLFTYAPPFLPLFCDPLTGTYGLSH